MEELGRRKGDLQDMQPDGRGRTRLEYLIPARGLIGFQNEFLTLTRGTGLMSQDVYKRQLSWCFPRTPSRESRQKLGSPARIAFFRRSCHVSEK